MGRLIEIQQGETCPARLTLHLDDAIRFWATGARVKSGTEYVRILGPYVPAVVGLHGGILAPAGPPNTVLVLPSRPGGASIEIFTGDPWGQHGSFTLQVLVEA